MITEHTPEDQTPLSRIIHILLKMSESERAKLYEQFQIGPAADPRNGGSTQ